MQDKEKGHLRLTNYLAHLISRIKNDPVGIFGFSLNDLKTSNPASFVVYDRNLEALELLQKNLGDERSAWEKSQNSKIDDAKDKEEKKRLVKANDPVKKVVIFRDLPIKLEWLSGETRQWPGCPYRNPMVNTNYGYLKNTEDGDGEEVDVYLSEPANEDAPVFMLSQLKKDDKTFDEHKFFLGFDSKQSAQQAYLNAMPAEMMGEMVEMTFEEFLEKYLQFHTDAPIILGNRFF